MNDEKDKTELFECDCHSRDHSIIAHKDLYTWEAGGENRTDINLFLEFVVTKGSWTANKYTGFKFVNFFRRIIWRFREAVKILFIGHYRVEDCWMPLRIDDEPLRLIGVSETKRLGEMLIKFAKDAEEFYKEKTSGK